MKYPPLNIHPHKQIRLLTILPLEDNAGTDSRVKCHLTNHCLDEEHFTPAYKAYLNRKDELGNWNKPEGYANARQAGQQTEPGDWVHIARPGNDAATTHLPDFRYTWGDYMALSYTLGDPSVSCEVVVNDHVMLVTRNVEACLRVLRGKPYVARGWQFWIDAICINQRDIVERANEVKRMRDIYTKAWTPLVWLGDEGDESNGALELIKSLAKNYHSHNGALALTQALSRDAKAFGSGRLRALYQLITRRYWRRAWILQEAALGRSTTPVLCGQQTLRWMDISRAFWVLNKTDEVINTYIKNELDEAGIEFDIAIWANLYTVGEIQLLQDVQIGHRRTNLYRLLNLGRTVFCTDPRDKIYGFLGLMDESLASLIIPDYTDPLLKVYRDFVKATVQATGSLDVIRHRFPSENACFPSWVPDWTVEPTTSALTLSHIDFAVSGKTVAEATYLNNDELLSCKGFKIDTFDGMGCLWSKAWSTESIIQTAGSTDPYGSIEAVREAIWQTMVANRSIYSEPLKDDYSSLLATPALTKMAIDKSSLLKELAGSNVMTWCVDFLNGCAEFRVCGRAMHEYFTEVETAANVNALHLRDALMQRDRINVRRKLVTTAKGYVGMTMEMVEKGDVLCVLLGCTMPMVLRPAGEQFGVVAECYIHGLMEGKAMEWLENGECQLEDIVLC